MAPKGAEYSELAHQRAIEKKTHVTFPQLKYPSLRDEGIGSPVQWLEGKAMDDGAEGLWRVHNGLYDLTEFIHKHPGGAEWLDLTKDTDITEAYESHHLNPTVDKILAKYYVRESKAPRNSPFTFHEDGFYCTLKKKVFEELKKVPSGFQKKSDWIIDGFFATYLLASAFCCYTKVPWLVNLSWIVASVSLTWTVAAAHNYIHRRTNWRMHLFSLSLWSYRDFRVSHALSHHLYPNTLMDLEISAFEPLVHWNPRKDKPMHRYIAPLIECVCFPFAFLINFSIRMLCTFFRKGFYAKHFHFTDLIGFLVPLWMWVVSGCTFYEAIITWAWILCSASFVFFTIASNAAHHHPDIWKDGDQSRSETPDWGMHELEAVMDRKEVNGNHFWVMAFFGYHSLHHLFPTLDHAIHELLLPILIEHAEKFRANFRVTSQLDLFIGQYKSAIKTDFKILDDNDKDK